MVDKHAKPSYAITSKLLTSADGTKIYAEAVGNPSKPSIVFVHGLALSGAVFDAIFQNAKLLAKYSLVRYDARGHARSGQPEAEDAYTSLRYAEDFQAVVKGFNLHKPIWAGWSVAGAISSDIVQHLGPDAVSAFVYIDGVPSMVGSEALRSDFLNGCVGGLLSPDAAGQAQSALTFVDGCFHQPQTVPFVIRMSMVGTTFLQSTGSRMRILMRQQDPTQLYKAAAGGLPVLFVYGKQDRLVLVDETAKHLRQHFKRLLIRGIDNVGHAPFMEAPETFSDHLIEFADQVC